MKKKKTKNINEEIIEEVVDAEEVVDTEEVVDAEEVLDSEDDGETETETEDSVAEDSEAEEAMEAEETVMEDAEDSEEDEDYEYGDEDYDEDEEEDEETYKRRMRHKRRVRSQIISYSVVAVFLIAIGIGVFYLVTFLMGVVTTNVKEKEVEAQIAAMNEEPQEEIVVEAPEAVVEEETEPIEEVDYLGDMVNEVIASMTLEDKVAQMFIITPEALTGVDAATKALEGTQNALGTYAVSGLVYDKRNIEDNEQLTTLLETTKGMSKYELFVAIEECGGSDGVIASSGLNDIPPTDSPADIAETGDSAQAYNAGNTISSYLSSFGFNMNIAPSGDMTMKDDAIHASYSFGSDEAVVSDMVAQMVSGLKAGDVFVCLTDFPGTGAVTEDTAKATVTSDISSDVVTGQLVPYISGIAAGADAVMMSNVIYSAADTSEMPASLSEYMIGTMLRGNMGYDGIVITGPLSDAAIKDNYSTEEIVLAAIKAGADILYKPADFEEAYNALLTAVNEGKIEESRLDESLNRILRVKFADDVE